MLGAGANDEIIRVCTSMKCSAKGSVDLLGDIEDMCVESTCKVQARGCFKRCLQGPNMEIAKNGSVTQIDDVNDFARVYKLVSSDMGVKISSTMKKVAALKYDARRSQGPERMALLQKAFGVLGDETKASRTYPLILTGLLMMRSVETVAERAEAAIKDAELAVTLAPTWGKALLHVALAFDASGKLDQARETIVSLKDKYAGDDTLMQRVSKLEHKMERDRDEARAQQLARDAEKEAHLQKQQRALAELQKLQEAELQKQQKQQAELQKQPEQQAKEQQNEKPAPKKKAQQRKAQNMVAETVPQEEEARRKAEEEEKEARRKGEEEDEQANRKREEIEAAKKSAIVDWVRRQEEQLQKAREARAAEVAEAEGRRKARAVMQEERRKQAATNASFFACCPVARDVHDAVFVRLCDWQIHPYQLTPR